MYAIEGTMQPVSNNVRKSKGNFIKYSPNRKNIKVING